MPPVPHVTNAAMARASSAGMIFCSPMPVAVLPVGVGVGGGWRKIVKVVRCNQARRGLMNLCHGFLAGYALPGAIFVKRWQRDPCSL